MGRIASQLGIRLDVVLCAEVHDLLGVGEAARHRARDCVHSEEQGHLVNLEEVNVPQLEVNVECCMHHDDRSCDPASWPITGAISHNLAINFVYMSNKSARLPGAAPRRHQSGRSCL